MISLEDIRYHYAMLQDALLIMQSGVGDISQARANYHNARGWLETHDAIGFLLELIDQKESDHE